MFSGKLSSEVFIMLIKIWIVPIIQELQDYLLQTEDSDLLRSKISGMDTLLEDFKDLIEDLKNGNSESHSSMR